MSSHNLVGKTKSQGWEIGVSRTLPVDPVKAWDMIMTALGLTPATPHEKPVYKKGMSFKTEDKTHIEIRSYEQGNMIRIKWQPDGWDFQSTLQIRVTPAKTGTTISVHHEWLQNAEQREKMRLHWTSLLDAFKASLKSG